MDFEISIPEDVQRIINTLINNGYEAYIVGGCVRDSILKRKPQDWDITTNAKPNDIIKLFEKVILTGIKHGTVTVVINANSFEVTTFRNDGEYEDNRHPKEVTFVNSIKEDLARRDFTINAMAYNQKDGLIDYFNGVNDLNNKIIRTVGEPYKRFNEDALRMLRAVRFSAQLDFHIEKNTLDIIKELKENVKSISKERIREEFNKLIISNPSKLNILKECLLLDLIIPEINKLYNYEQNNPYHIFDLYEHTIKAMEAIEPILHLRLAMLLHDFGKIKTKTVDDKGIFHYYSHAEESVLISESILKNLKYDNNLINKVINLIKYHDYNFKSKISIKKLLNKIGIDLFADLIKIKRADILAQNPLYAKERLLNLIEVESKVDLIIEQEECFQLRDLKISGQDLISIGFEKGKIIGDVLSDLLEIVINKPELNDNNILINLAKKRLS